MNAVEIEHAVSKLAEQPFNQGEFPFQFLAAFGDKDVTLKRLRTSVSNKSDVGSVLQANSIHIATCVQTLPRPARRGDSTLGLAVSGWRQLGNFTIGSGVAVGKFGRGADFAACCARVRNA